MKEVFTPEVARELGYQKYWPEKKDWLLAIVGVLAFMGLVLFTTLYIMEKTGYTARLEQEEKEKNLVIKEWCNNTEIKTLSEQLTCLKTK